MAGHLGAETVTTQNLEIVRVDAERGLIMIRGAVPGAEGTYVKIRDAAKKKAPEGAPMPGGFRLAQGDAPAADQSAPAVEADTAADAQAPAEQTEGGEQS
jgi:large subunit ribosomal protein L3